MPAAFLIKSPHSIRVPAVVASSDQLWDGSRPIFAVPTSMNGQPCPVTSSGFGRSATTLLLERVRNNDTAGLLEIRVTAVVISLTPQERAPNSPRQTAVPTGQRHIIQLGSSDSHKSSPDRAYALLYIQRRRSGSRSNTWRSGFARRHVYRGQPLGTGEPGTS
jgi:hypothetical protein